MKTIEITFGTGNDAMTHKIEVNHPDQLVQYLQGLQNAGWKLCEITSITGGWQ